MSSQVRSSGRPRYRHHGDGGAAGVPAAAARRGHLVTGPAPLRGQSPADVFPADNDNVHQYSSQKRYLPSGSRRILYRWPNNSRAYRWSNGWYGFLIIPDMTITLGPVRLLRIRQGSIVMTG
jgi:hypothetical protein